MKFNSCAINKKVKKKLKNEIQFLDVKLSMDPDTDKWNVTLKKGRMVGDWFVLWVKVKTNAPTTIFHCNFTTLLDSSIWESINKKEKEAVATCSTNGTFFE